MHNDNSVVSHPNVSFPAMSKYCSEIIIADHRSVLVKGDPLVKFVDHCLQVSDQCRDGGPISPSKCIYMKDWLAEL